MINTQEPSGKPGQAPLAFDIRYDVDPDLGLGYI